MTEPAPYLGRVGGLGVGPAELAWHTFLGKQERVDHDGRFDGAVDAVSNCRQAACHREAINHGSAKFGPKLFFDIPLGILMKFIEILAVDGELTQHLVRVFASSKPRVLTFCIGTLAPGQVTCALGVIALQSARCAMARKTV